MSRASHNARWMRLGWSTWMLGAEAATVIGLRTMKIAAGGPDAAAESRRMVSEKLKAAAALQALAMTGGLGTTAVGAATRSVAHYRRTVRANRKRLAKG